MQCICCAKRSKFYICKKCVSIFADKLNLPDSTQMQVEYDEQSNVLGFVWFVDGEDRPRIAYGDPTTYNVLHFLPIPVFEIDPKDFLDSLFTVLGVVDDRERDEHVDQPLTDDPVIAVIPDLALVKRLEDNLGNTDPLQELR